MHVSPEHLIERVGVQTLGALVSQELGWLFREQSTSDYGIDAHLEVVDHGHATGRLVAAQIKAGPSYFREPTVGGWVFRPVDAHVQYWLNHTLPVLVVLYEEQTRRACWQAVTRESVTSTGDGYRMTVPAAQVLDRTARDVLDAFAREPRPGGDRLEERLDAILGRLPHQVASRLRGASVQLMEQAGGNTAPSAVRAVERLAQLLADGNPAPEAAIASLLKRPPKWAATSTAVADLWAAVAGYACEHGLDGLAPDAFSRAVEAGAVPVGRWRAFAGLTMIGAESEQAGTTLDRAATEEGGALLAAVGIAALHARREGTRGPVPIPPAVLTAMEDPEQARTLEPTVRQFVADQRLAAGDVSAAVDILEQALSQVPGSTGIQLGLARALLRRVVDGLSPVRDSDLHRARALAELARADRRRWRGPSEEAAEVLLQARVIAHDYVGAIATAVAPPDGEAAGREAGNQRLVAHAIRVALRAHDQRAEALEARITDDAVKAQIAAIRADANDAPLEVRCVAWRRALAAADDDEQRAVAVRGLALLGESPTKELQTLGDRGVLSPEDTRALETIAEASQTEPDAAIVQLRPLSQRHFEAAQRLAELLEVNGRTDEAVDVWDRAARRFGEQVARIAAVELLARAGRTDEADARGQRLLARADMPAALRRQIRRGLIENAQDRQDWSAVEELAEQGLVEARPGNADTAHPSQIELPPEAVDYAWLVAMARYNSRDISRAAAAVRELRPPVRNLLEARIWLRVIHASGWTASQAAVAIDLANRFIDDPEFAGHVVIALISATAEVPADSDDGEPLPATPLVLDEATGQSLTELVQRYRDLHPDGVIRAVEADTTTLLDQVRARAEFDAHLERLRDLVWLGLLPMGALAQLTRAPYMQLLLQRGAGVLPACDPDPEQYDADLAAARDALHHKIVVEPSAIAVATLLNNRWTTLVAQFAAAVLPRPCFDDILAATDAIDSHMRAIANLSVDPRTGQIVNHPLSTDERRYLARRLGQARAAAQELQVVGVADLRHTAKAMTRDIEQETLDGHLPYDISTEGSWLAPLEVALTEGLPVWSDDFVLRRTLRGLGVDTFSTPALLHALYDAGRIADTTDEDTATFLSEYVVDLPRRPDPIISLAHADDWQPRGPALALARPSWWFGRGIEQGDIHASLAAYLRVAKEIHTNQSERLPGWFGLAARGFAAQANDQNRATAIAQLAAATVSAVTGLDPHTIRDILSAAEEAHADLTRLAGAPTVALGPHATTEALPSQPPVNLADPLREQLRRWLTNPAHEGGRGLSDDRAATVLRDAFAEIP
jgi:tetratricopeptide (TPR) repeat protein